MKTSEKVPNKFPAVEDKQRVWGLQRYRKEIKMLHKGSRPWVEIKILSYLHSFENTREDDLIVYTVRSLNKSVAYIRKTLRRMVREGKVKQIVHKKLKPQMVYYVGPRYGEGIDYNLWLLACIDSDGNLEKYRKAIKTELQKNHKVIA
jgi:hypothetical protein